MVTIEFSVSESNRIALNKTESARVLELVDKTDLKSVAPKGRAGSIPASGTEHG